MAINKNHEFEELNGVKCAIVEKNILRTRVEFLERLLTSNGYTVVITAAAPPKAAAPAQAPEPEIVASTTNSEPELFTLGVTDVMFNPVNAIFGRLLKTPEGRVVTLAYWKQHETISHDQVPYYENR